MPPIDFAVSDKEMIATIEKTEEPEEMIKSLLVSNEQAYIKSLFFLFLTNCGKMGLMLKKEY